MLFLPVVVGVVQGGLLSIVGGPSPGASAYLLAAAAAGGFVAS